MTSWSVLASEVFKRGLKNDNLLNESQSLKTVIICPWKILEKSLKFFLSEVVRTMYTTVKFVQQKGITYTCTMWKMKYL